MLPTGYTVAVCRKDSGETKEQDIRCEKGRVIHIMSATVGYSDHLTIDNDECIIHDRVECRRRTNILEIMQQCNGRRNCSLDDDAFNYPETVTCDESRGVNFIKITYSCINGERTYFLSRFSQVIR